MEIIHLPIDMFSYITTFMDGKDITFLWMCGNKLVNQKISSKNVINRFVLILKKKTRFFQNNIYYPPIINNFVHLRELVIKHDIYNSISLYEYDPLIVPQEDEYTLPYSLTHLELNNNYISPYLIKHLPMSLIYLKLSDDMNLTDSCIEFLPRTLKHLDLCWNSNLTNSSIKYIPRLLTYLNLSCNKILNDLCIPDLPPSLTYFNLSKN